MTRRRLTILLHWSVFLLMLMMIKGGTAAPTLRWAFVLSGGLMVGMAIVGGLLGKPGPKLTGIARAAHPWMHWAMYGVLLASVILNALALFSLTSLQNAWVSLLVLLVFSTFHGIFHFWRHTALNDGALRIMTPKFIHKIL